MAGEWIESPFPEAIDFQEGPGILAKDFRPTGVPLVRLSGLERGASILSGCNHLDPAMVERRWRHFRLEKGDIVLSTSASLGRLAVVTDEGVGAIAYTGIIRMRPRDNRVYAPFIQYLLEGPDFQRQAEMMGSGSVIRHFGPFHLRQMTVTIPPFSEQRAIAHILGTLDDKIELNRRMNQTLEEIARALFKSWFVDFDPVRAKADGRDTGLSPHLGDVFPDRFEDSELGEIPKGWSVGTVANHAAFIGGYAFKSSDWIDQGVPVVKIGSVKPGFVDLNEVTFVSDLVAQEAKRFRLRPGDLLIGMTGYVGEVGLVPYTNNPPLLNQRVGKFVLEQPGTSALAFLYCLTRRPEFKAAVESKSHGTAQANVSAAGILSIPALLPTGLIRDHFNRICHPLLDGILANHAESRTLAALRDSLLPKLISGEIRVNQEAGSTVGPCA
jgi:type I restriction enzyme S subunit